MKRWNRTCRERGGVRAEHDTVRDRATWQRLFWRVVEELNVDESEARHVLNHVSRVGLADPVSIREFGASHAALRALGVDHMRQSAFALAIQCAIEAGDADADARGARAINSA